MPTIAGQSIRALSLSEQALSPPRHALSLFFGADTLSFAAHISLFRSRHTHTFSSLWEQALSLSLSEHASFSLFRIGAGTLASGAGTLSLSEHSFSISSGADTLCLSQHASPSSQQTHTHSLFSLRVRILSLSFGAGTLSLSDHGLSLLRSTHLSGTPLSGRIFSRRVSSRDTSSRHASSRHASSRHASSRHASWSL
ncbi:hypothetical protein EDB80DRAFT_320180 [Ilyonectria destructans]|nr:hypothetical protein EDB80DRAFT_320180 [Ilyonectria destructans]